jgi:hypothetical protein
MSLLSSLLACPKYLGFIAGFSIFIDYYRNPKYQDWRWFLLMGLSVINIGMIVYKRYKEGISLGIIADIIWIALYAAIIYIYVIPFDNKDIVKERLKNDPLKIGTKLPWLAGIGLTLSILIVVACVCQVIPVVNVVAIPLMRVLSFVI